MADTLERYVGAGDRDDPIADSVLSGLEQFGVHPERHDVQLSDDTRSPLLMSAADVDETVSSSGICWATFCCIAANPYHRRTSGLRHHGAAATSRILSW